MQTSVAGAGHSPGVSTGRTVSRASCFSGSDVNSEARLRIARCCGCESDRGPSIRTSGAGTLARATGVSGDSGSAVSILIGIESTVPTSASDETGLGDARSAGATSARTVAAVDASIRSGIPTTAVPTALGMGIIAVACGASAASRSAVKNIGTSGESRSSVAAAWKCSMPGESSPAGQPVTQPARSTVPPKAARAANRALIITLASPLGPGPPILNRRVQAANYIVIFW